jgi:hypothetical protein
MHCSDRILLARVAPAALLPLYAHVLLLLIVMLPGHTLGWSQRCCSSRASRAGPDTWPQLRLMRVVSWLHRRADGRHIAGFSLHGGSRLYCWYTTLGRLALAPATAGGLPTLLLQAPAPCAICGCLSALLLPAGHLLWPAWGRATVMAGLLLNMSWLLLLCWLYSSISHRHISTVLDALLSCCVLWPCD